jgi:hypothetical protein
MVLIRSFQGMEYFIAHSVGVSIHRLTWASPRFSSSATMILIETFITFAIGTTVTGGTVIGSTLAIGGTVVMGSIMKLTTTITSITAPTTGLAIPATAASPVSTAVVSGDSMEAKDSTEDIVAKASMEEAALVARTEWEAVMVAAVTTEH